MNLLYKCIEEEMEREREGGREGPARNVRDKSASTYNIISKL